MAETGTAARAQLAAAARAAGVGRASGLMAGPCFAELCTPPAWLTAAPPERERLGALAALLSVAPSLRRCVDGKVLGPLADAFGDDALEAALQHGDEEALQDDVSANHPTPDALRAAGQALLGRAAAGDGAAARLMQAATYLPVAGADAPEPEVAA